MALLAIDPGKVTGFAEFERSSPPVFRTGDLIRATACSEEECMLLIENAVPVRQRKPAGDCIIEVPQVYPGQQQKGDQNDLITLALMVGRYSHHAAAHGFQVKLVKPREWKGQLPKDVCWRRVSETLSPSELAKLEKLPKSRAHNRNDAIGLGTWFQKRWR